MMLSGRFLSILFVLPFAEFLGGCAEIETEEKSMSRIWQRFGGKPLAEVSREWGYPIKETQGPDGIEATWRYTYVHDARSTHDHKEHCDAVMTAKGNPARVSSIVLKGKDAICSAFSKGGPGEKRVRVRW